jgi:hypothetical protein
MGNVQSAVKKLVDRLFGLKQMRVRVGLVKSGQVLVAGPGQWF